MTPRGLLEQHASEVAPALLGAHLTSTVDGDSVTIRLTEVEAYGGLGEDPGSHAFRRMTSRNATMFGRAGVLYVYFTYGMHWCANIVTGHAGAAGAVLLRAGEVVAGVEAAQRRRAACTKDRELARGPARLATSLGITGALDGVDVLDRRSSVRLTLTTPDHLAVAQSMRTGVGGAGAATPWRFFIADDPTVSPYRPARTRTGG